MAAKLKDLESIEEILSEMTLQEKAALVIGGSPMSSASFEKYGIPALFMIDCCNGVNTFQYAVDKTYHEAAKALEEKGEPVDREKLTAPCRKRRLRRRRPARRRRPSSRS